MKELEWWIARDSDGSLWIFGSNPKLHTNGTIWQIPYGYSLPFFSSLFPSVTYENSPKRITLKIED